jgi:hypothetical protein
MVTSRGFIPEMYRYWVVVPGYRVEDGVEAFILWWWRGISELVMSVVFSNVLVFDRLSDTSLCRFRVMLAPGIGKACHVNEAWFDWGSNRSIVKF